MQKQEKVIKFMGITLLHKETTYNEVKAEEECEPCDDNQTKIGYQITADPRQYSEI